MGSVALSFLFGICIVHHLAFLPSAFALLLVIGLLFFNVGIYFLLRVHLQKITQDYPNFLLQAKLRIANIIQEKFYHQSDLKNHATFQYSLIYHFYVLRLFLVKKLRWLLELALFLLKNSMIVALGFIYASMYASTQLADHFPEHLEKKPLRVQGRICSLPEERNGILSFNLDVHSLVLEDNSAFSAFSVLSPADRINNPPSLDQVSNRPTLWKNPGKIRLMWKGNKKQAMTVLPGEVWEFVAKLKIPRSYANPGSFDSERQAFLNHIKAQGYVLEQYQPRKISNDWYSQPILRLRYLIRQRIYEHLSKSNYAGLIAALIVGAKEGISTRKWEVFQRTGTSHLMAISGLHIGLVSGNVYFLAQKIAQLFSAVFLKIPAPILAGSLSVLVSVFYACIAGFSLPTERALIMIVLLIVGTTLRRQVSVIRIFFLTLLFVLVFDPLAPLSSGFWLSFLAVGVLLYGLQNRLQAEGVWNKFIAPQLVIFFALLPVSFYLFGQVSLISPVANSISIPWVSFLVVPFALLGCVFLPFSDYVSHKFFWLSEKLFSLLWPFLEFLANKSYASVQFSTISLVSVLIASVGMLGFISAKGFPARKLSIIFILPLFLSTSHTIKKSEFICSVLDVGQGLAMVIQTQNHVLVFDTGAKLSPEMDLGARVVLPYLRTQHIKKIDTIIISHNDNDHRGGLESILKGLPVSSILASDQKKLPQPSNTIVQHCNAGQKWEWDGVYFEMLHPIEQKDREVEWTYKKFSQDLKFVKVSKNNASCVLKVQTGAQSVLLTGDIEAVAEQSMLKNYAALDLQATVLIVPHHGSRSSSSLEFIQGVKPKLAILSAGYKNRYQHPHREIEQRYKDCGVQLYNTADTGLVRFLVTEQSLKNIERYRMDQRRYWNN